jgi:hypothetical protein
MNKLQEFFEKLQKIQDTYDGNKTDWEAKRVQLNRLHKEISNYRFNASKSAIFNEHMRKHLEDDIRNECERVTELARKQNQ